MVGDVNLFLVKPDDDSLPTTTAEVEIMIAGKES